MTQQPEIQVRKRIIVPLAPTETPAGVQVPRPSHTEIAGNLGVGIVLLRIYADFERGCWYAVLDVTDSPAHATVPPWAPGIQAPVLVPQQSVQLVQAATAAQPKILLPNQAPTPKLELAR